MEKYRFDFQTIDELVTSIEVSAERCECLLYLLTRIFRASYDNEMKMNFATDYHTYRILLDMAYTTCDEITGHVEWWKKIAENYHDQKAKEGAAE